MLWDLLLIITASLLSTLLAEGISWVLIYRTASYQLLKASIDKTSKKLERKKEESSSTVGNLAKTKTKRIDRYEETLKTQQRDLSLVKMKSMFAVGFTMVAIFGLLGSYFDGKVVARLPFEPFSLVRGLSHRNLPGDDYYECSMMFFYVLCSMGLRSNLQKLLGVAPPKTAGGSSWFMPPQ